MRLFGEQGYAATSVAQIEEAAGLAPGSGSLYKHFRSKEELLSAGLEQLLSSRGATLAPLDAPPADTTADTSAALEAAARAGLERMGQDRDLNRVLFRGLAAFPELLEKFGEEEIARIGKDTAEFLAGLAGAGDRHTDWEALATVLQGATAHYWLLEDLFGAHPTGVSRERFVNALVGLAEAGIAAPPRR